MSKIDDLLYEKSVLLFYTPNPLYFLITGREKLYKEVKTAHDKEWQRVSKEIDKLLGDKTMKKKGKGTKKGGKGC